MNENVDSTMKALDAAKKIAASGVEYWMGREITEILGYKTWEYFKRAVERAAAACAGTGEVVQNHFRDTTKKVEIGSGTHREVEDFFLTRYACYLIAMNGDPSKAEIASAQGYFAVQTRRQELADANALLEQRIDLRLRVSESFKELSKTATIVGVQSYAIFHAAGYRDFYGMAIPDIKRRKGIPETDDIMDHAGRAELAANDFRLTQTEEKLRRGNVQGQQQALAVQREVSNRVRETIKAIGGKMPEDMPAEPSVKRLTRERRRKLLKGPKTKT